MFNIGRVCVKVAGRDAKGLAVVVDVLDSKFVLIEGTVRRRKCNVNHLEPTKFTVDVKKNAAKDIVVAKLKELGFEIPEEKKRSEKKSKTEKPKKGKKVKEKVVKVKKEEKKAAPKKAEKPTETKKASIEDAVAQEEAPKKEKTPVADKE